MANAKIIEQKAGVVSEIKEKLENAKSVVMFDYRGLSVAEVTELRRKLRENGADYKVGMECEVIVIIDGKAYIQPFTIATHVIGTKDEMIGFFATYSNGATVDTTGWYVVLTDNITLTAENSSDPYVRFVEKNKLTWLGRFNGLGHTVSNISLTGLGGLFGNLGENSIIENVGFTNLTIGKFWYVIANKSSGVAVVRNVYLQGTASTGEAIMVSGGNGTKISNVVANFKNTLEGSKDDVSFWEYSSTLSNNYCIGNFDKVRYSGETTGATLCGDITNFNTKYLTNFTSENGFNEYWSIKDGSLYFGDTKIL